MTQFRASTAHGTDVCVLGHGEASIARFEEALLELDRPFSVRLAREFGDLQTILAEAGQVIVVANDRLEGCTLGDVVACCAGSGREVPLIVVSEESAENAGEGTAHSLIKAGVRDYVYMDRLYRLFWAVQRELVRMDERRETRQIESRFAAILDIAPDAVVAADAAHRIIVFNRAAEAIFGYAAEEVLGRPLESLMPHRYAHDHRARVGHYAATPGKAREMGERGGITAVRKDGTEFPAEASISILREEKGPVFVGILRDVTQKKLVAERIAFLATHDSLTGIPNRTLLNDRLKHALERAERENRTVALIFVDLDGFKQVNDSFGHAAGDELLRTVASRFVSCMRGSDTVARLGGDEFAMVLEGIEDIDSVHETAARVLECARRPVLLAGGRVRISASIGAALATAGDKTAAELMIEADLAMYEAKAAGKDRFACPAATRPVGDPGHDDTCGNACREVEGNPGLFPAFARRGSL